MNPTVEETIRFRPRPTAPGDLLRALRPREKLAARGPASLSAKELLALLLGTGSREEPVARLAERLVRRRGLAGLARLGVRELMDERGLGPATAARLAAAFELGRRAFAAGTDRRPKIAGPADVYALARDLGRARKERLVGFYLDAQNRLLCRETISMGTLNTTRTHPREILYPALKHLAYGFILAHNHPSGCLDPSSEDVDFTDHVRRGAQLMGIELYDHLIVTATGYTSLRERGML